MLKFIFHLHVRYVQIYNVLTRFLSLSWFVEYAVLNISVNDVNISDDFVWNVSLVMKQ